MATFTSGSVEETIAFGRQWAETLAENDVVALVGELGAGKTHFVKGLLQRFESSEEATSPTFTLVHEYRSGRLPIFHFDFYRLKTAQEGGITVIEWADRFPELLPERTRWLRFQIENGSRRVIIEQEK